MEQKVDSSMLKNNVKALVNFKGTGSISIRDSYNISSITDLGVGTYLISMSSALPNSAYIISGTCGNIPLAGGVSNPNIETEILDNVSFKINTSDATNNSSVDFEIVALAVFSTD